MTVTPALNCVASIRATSEPGVFILHCNITDMEGNTCQTVYCSRPEDVYGLNPTIRHWLLENPSFPVQLYSPPAGEDIRVELPPLSAGQLRLGLLKAGILPSQVSAALASMPAGTHKYAPTFVRAHPLVAIICTTLGLTEEQMDALWAEAHDL